MSRSRWLGIVRVARTPAVHFVLLGVLLFAVRGVLPDGEAPAPRSAVVLAAEDVERLAADFAEQWGAPPAPAELAALVEQALDEQVLEREARRLALDYGDRAVRRWLVRKMRAVDDDPALGEAALYRAAIEIGLDDDLVIRRHLRQKMRLALAGPVASFGDDELAAALERHRDRFVRPPTYAFSQVFFSARLHGGRLEERCAVLSSEIRSLSPAQAAGLSDPFPLALGMTDSSREAVARRFGAGFAAAVAELAPGRWSPPIASPFGRHLVWVHESHEERLPPLAEVRDRLVRILGEERRQTQVRRGLERLRALYGVRVEWPGKARS